MPVRYAMTFCQRGTRSIGRTRTSHAPRPCPYITTADMLTLDSIPSYAKPGASYDHESTWAYPATSDGWYRIHDAIRMGDGQVCRLPEGGERAPAGLAGGVPADVLGRPREPRPLSPRARGRALHSHAQRAHRFPEKLEADHDAVLELMADVGAAVKALKEGGDVSDALAKFETYKATMEPHLVEEQNILVPLMRAYYPHGEVNKKVAEIMQKLDPVHAGAFVHSFAGKNDFMSFMSQEKIPFFVWYIAFKSHRAVYRKEMESRRRSSPASTRQAPYSAKAELQTAVKCGEFAWRQAK